MKRVAKFTIIFTLNLLYIILLLTVFVDGCRSPRWWWTWHTKTLQWMTTFCTLDSWNTTVVCGATTWARTADTILVTRIAETNNTFITLSLINFESEFIIYIYKYLWGSERTMRIFSAFWKYYNVDHFHHSVYHEFFAVCQHYLV